MKPVTVEEVVKEQALFLLPCVLLTLTGAVLNIVVARTPRWRQAAWLLLGTVTAELVMAIVGILAMGPSFIPAEGQPLLTRLSFHAASIMLPLSWWWIVVIIGEFATACRETILLGQVERVGYGILASFSALMMFIGWTLPSPVISDDDTTTFLKAFNALLQVIVFFWLLFPISRAYIVCSLLITRIDEVKQVMSDHEQSGMK
jgi:hypothetical protein